MDEYAPWASVLEGTTAEIKFTIVDQDGVGVQPVTLAWYLYDLKTEKVINSRANVSISPVATYVTAGGVFTWTLATADNVFHNAGLRSEIHCAKFVATWSTGTKTAKFHVPFILKRDTEPA